MCEPDRTIYDSPEDEARRKALHLTYCNQCGEDGWDGKECHACGRGIRKCWCEGDGCFCPEPDEYRPTTCGGYVL